MNNAEITRSATGRHRHHPVRRLNDHHTEQLLVVVRASRQLRRQPWRPRPRVHRPVAIGGTASTTAIAAGHADYPTFRDVTMALRQVAS